MKKVLSIGIMGTLGLVGSTFAMSMSPNFTNTNNDQVNYMGGTPCFDERTGKYIEGCKKDYLKKLKEEKQEQIQNVKNQVKEFKENYKEKLHQINSAYRPTIQQEWKDSLKNLKEKISKLRQTYRLKFKALREKFKTATAKERKEILQQMAQLKQQLHQQIAQLGEKSTYVQTLLKKWEEKQKLRQQKQQYLSGAKAEIKKIRQEYKEARADLIAKIKTIIYQRFQKKINNMSLAKLEKVKEKIQKAKERFEKMPLSEERKAQIMSVLAALDEVITQRIDELQNQAQQVDADSLLNNLLGD